MMTLEKRKYTKSWPDRYEGVDWTLQDTEIARVLDVSREAVRQQRRKRNAPDSPRKGKNKGKFKLNPETQAMLDLVPKIAGKKLSEIYNLLPPDLKKFFDSKKPNALMGLYQFLYSHKIEFKPNRPFTWVGLIDSINWDLPNVDLDNLWNRKKQPNIMANLRCRYKKPAAKWDGRLNHDSPDYKAALAAEEKKANEYYDSLTEQ